MYGPTLAISQNTHADKYRQPNETYEKAMTRIAKALRDDELHYKAFRAPLMDMRFMPAGRIQSAVGSPREVTAWNCFVAPTIEDSFTEGSNSIMDVASKAATTLRQGGGIGYDFSTLRPRNDIIRSLGSRSSGPIAFMNIFDAVCQTVASAGHRRGAQMATIRVDHPDIFEFIAAKAPQQQMMAVWRHIESLPESPERQALYQALQSTLPLQGFNISVGITHKFMECLSAGKPFPLQFQGVVYREIDPQELWDKIMRATWDWAEPGVLFIDRMNEMNNLWYCEQIAATNPCGEQPLPPNGACLLGSFTIPKYITKSLALDITQLRKDIPGIVRAMDNVIDRGFYPLPEQGREGRSKRRMGLGVTGLANAIEAMGYPYGSQKFVNMEAEILSIMRDEIYLASAQLSREKGAFALYDKEKYLEGKFIQTLDQDVQKEIARTGIRNSHLLSIAPTGTISLCADNVSSGIEPVYSYNTQRTIQTMDGPIVTDVPDYGFSKWGVKGKTTDQVTIDEHLDVLLTAQAHVDSAVSKTCNIGDNVTFEEFKSVYVRAYEGGAKGCTTFRAAGKRMGILVAQETKTTDEGASCMIMPDGSKSCE